MRGRLKHFIFQHRLMITLGACLAGIVLLLIGWFLLKDSLLTGDKVAFGIAQVIVSFVGWGITCGFLYWHDLDYRHSEDNGHEN